MERLWSLAGAIPATERPLVTTARIAIYDDNRGPQIRHHCGRAALAKTVIVYIARRAYWPAESASQGVYFVSRFPAGYRVWQVAH